MYGEVGAEGCHVTLHVPLSFCRLPPPTPTHTLAGGVGKPGLCFALLLFFELSTQPLVHRPNFSFLTVDNHHPQPPPNTAKMGRVRTKTVKKSAKVLIERFYPRLTLDFETNKRICDEIAIIASKRLRNKIAGYTTHLMKRIQEGPVRGISFKLQEEERERKDQYVPEVSALDFTQNSESGQLDVDAETKDLLKHLGVSLHHLPRSFVAPARWLAARWAVIC